MRAEIVALNPPASGAPSSTRPTTRRKPWQWPTRWPSCSPARSRSFGTPRELYGDAGQARTRTPRGHTPESHFTKGRPATPEALPAGSGCPPGIAPRGTQGSWIVIRPEI